MKKITLFTIIILLLSQISFALEVGYVDILKVVNNYPLAQKYKKEINKKYEEINNYVNKTENELLKIKDNKEKVLKKQQEIEKVEQKQKEYVSLRNKREEEINNNIRLLADKIREEKNLDIIIKKESSLSGGVDLTQEFINRLK